MVRNTRATIVGALMLTLLLAAGCATFVESGGVTVRETVVQPAVADSPEEVADLIPIFDDSAVRYDDRIGFEELFVVVGEDEVRTVMGRIRRQFLRPDEGRSELEIMLFYEQTIADLGGTILFRTRSPRSVEIDGESLASYFRKQRTNRGLSTGVADHTQFPGSMNEYLSAVVPFGDGEAYVVIATGRRQPEAAEFRGPRFEIVTVDP